MMRVTWRSGHWTKASLASRSKACVSLPGRERREARYMVVRAVTWLLFTTPVLANGVTWVPVLRCRSSSTALVSPGRGGRSESRRAARGRPPGWTASRSWHPESAWWRGGALYWPVKCTPPSTSWGGSRMGVCTKCCIFLDPAATPPSLSSCRTWAQSLALATLARLQHTCRSDSDFYCQVLESPGRHHH